MVRSLPIFDGRRARGGSWRRGLAVAALVCLGNGPGGADPERNGHIGPGPGARDPVASDRARSGPAGGPRVLGSRWDPGATLGGFVAGDRPGIFEALPGTGVAVRTDLAGFLVAVSSGAGNEGAADAAVLADPTPPRASPDGPASPGAGAARGVAVRLAVVDPRPTVVVRGEERLPGSAHLHRADGRRVGLTRYGALRWSGVRPGVDLVLRAPDGERRGLRYDVETDDPAALAGLRFRLDAGPGTRLRLGDDGRLHATAGQPGDPRARGAGGTWTLSQTRPVAWIREASGGVRPVRCRFVPQGGGTFGFALEDPDAGPRPGERLVVDPELLWSGYFGGSSSDSIRAVDAVPGLGVVVGGFAGSTDLPTVPGVFQPTGGGDGFVARFDAQGRLAWVSYLGAAGRFEEVRAVALVPGGVPEGGSDVLACGVAQAGFPTTPGAFQRNYGGQNPQLRLGDGFVTRFAPDGTALRWSTYLGGAQDDAVAAVHVDPDSGAVTVAGFTASADFPTTPGSAFPVYGSQSGFLPDGFVARFTPGGGRVWATFVGGLVGDWIEAVDVDASGRVGFGGFTNGPDFPTTPGAFARSLSGPTDGVAGVLSADGAALEWASYVGGGRDDFVSDVGFDPRDGTLVAVGRSREGLGAMLPGTVVEPMPLGGFDAFAVRFAADGTGLVSGTYLGGAADDRADAVLVEPWGSIVVGGSTDSPGFPTTADAAQRAFGGFRDSFVVRLDPEFGRVWSSTLLGGTERDTLAGMAPDGTGGVFAAGSTFSSDFPVAAGGTSGLGTALGGTQDGFLQRTDVVPTLNGGPVRNAGPGSVGGGAAFDPGDEIEGLAIALRNASDQPITVRAWDLVVGGIGPFDGIEGLTLYRDLDGDGRIATSDPLLVGPVALARADADPQAGGALRLELPGGLLQLAPGEAVDLVVGIRTAPDCAAGTEVALALAGEDLRALGGVSPGMAAGTVDQGPVWICLGPRAPTADVDGDGRVTVGDVRRLASTAGAASGGFDPDGDGVVGPRDREVALAVLLGRRFVSRVPVRAVPGGIVAVDGLGFDRAGVTLRLGGRLLEALVRTDRRVAVRVPADVVPGTPDLEIVSGDLREVVQVEVVAGG